MINIGTNARDAMPRGGNLVLSANAEYVGKDELHLAGLAAGSYVRLSVADNGTGMDAATLARVSEPFFTTKPLGRGTGLGLAMVRGFAEQSGGAFLVTSAPDAGTIVVIWLRQAPTTEGSDSAGEPHGAMPAAVPAQILLVDDDDLVRKMLAVVLEDEGFVILQAASGEEALRLMVSGIKVDAMVTNFSMPGMNGITTISQIRALRPLLPCLLLTGYTSERLGVSEDHGFIVLRKPISGTDLAAQIEAALARR